MSYTYLRFHVTFSTKDRQPIIRLEWKDELFRYIGGIIRRERGRLLTADGVADHIHLYLSSRADQSVADLTGRVKANSSGWMHSRWENARGFYWQEEYAAFTVSPGDEKRVIEYIKNQVKHHERIDFKTEFRQLLEEHGIEIDERYIWK
ncbi:MAG: transposase [Acidobacteriia bacterium]|nr:transposase [Terriglobia bacterium]